MDLVLLVTISTFLNSKILLPQNHPKAFEHFQQLVETHQEPSAVFNELMAILERTPVTDDNNKPDAATEESIALAAMMQDSTQNSLLIFVVYFFLCEAFMKGATLGKRMVRLRTINLLTGQPCTFFESLVRSFLKSFTMLAFPLQISHLYALANKKRRTGHDYLSRTIVIDEKNPPEPANTTPQKTENK